MVDSTEASELSRHDEDTIRWLVQDGALDTKNVGDGCLIEKASLHEYQEALALVLHWND